MARPSKTKQSSRSRRLVESRATSTPQPTSPQRPNLTLEGHHARIRKCLQPVCPLCKRVYSHATSNKFGQMDALSVHFHDACLESFVNPRNDLDELTSACAKRGGIGGGYFRRAGSPADASTRASSASAEAVPALDFMDEEEIPLSSKRPSASEEKRLERLATDPCIERFGVDFVECKGCGKVIRTDTRRRHYPYLFNKHQRSCAGCRKRLTALGLILPPAPKRGLQRAAQTSMTRTSRKSKGRTPAVDDDSDSEQEDLSFAGLSPASSATHSNLGQESASVSTHARAVHTVPPQWQTARYASAYTLSSASYGSAADYYYPPATPNVRAAEPHERSSPTRGDYPLAYTTQMGARSHGGGTYAPQGPPTTQWGAPDQYPAMYERSSGPSNHSAYSEPMYGFRSAYQRPATSTTYGSQYGQDTAGMLRPAQFHDKYLVPMSLSGHRLSNERSTSQEAEDEDDYETEDEGLGAGR